MTLPLEVRISGARYHGDIEINLLPLPLFPSLFATAIALIDGRITRRAFIDPRSDFATLRDKKGKKGVEKRNGARKGGRKNLL